MMEIERLLSSINLLALVGGNLKRVASSGGGEYAGPCPFCGGVDRFRVQPQAKPGRWLCRACTDGKWQDAISFVMRRDHCDFKEACRRLGAEETGAYTRQHLPPTQITPAYAAPASDWQAAARQVIATCQQTLWSPAGERARRWLNKKRGLADETLRRFQLGFSLGSEIGGLWVPHGVVIPCEALGEIWYLKIRTNSNQSGRKYLGVKGSRTGAIYNVAALSADKPALLCEGELDTLLAWQHLNAWVSPVTFGSATNLPDLARWGAFLLPVPQFLLTYDADPAGRNGAARVLQMSDRAKLALLPAGYKDITDYYCSGGDLEQWLREFI